VYEDSYTKHAVQKTRRIASHIVEQRPPIAKLRAVSVVACKS
jgi:hypothetical protein